MSSKKLVYTLLIYCSITRNNFQIGLYSVKIKKLRLLAKDIFLKRNSFMIFLQIFLPNIPVFEYIQEFLRLLRNDGPYLGNF